jgi:hypothetical protein
MAQIKNRRSKSLSILLATLLTVAGAGIAFAYWTASGTGTGEATTGDSVALVIESEPAEGDLAPGSDGQTVAFTVTNPGPGVQSFTSMAVSLADEDGTPWVPAGDCLIADYTATISTPPTFGALQPEASVEGVATVTLSNTNENQDDCQGQTVPLYFTTEAVPVP